MVIFLGFCFFLFLLLGMPIGFGLGVTGVLGLFKSSPDLLSIAPSRFFEGINMFTILAMPFFIFAGEIMNKIGITDRIINLANVLVGHIKGGLAHANIVASIFFAGLTGAAVSDTAALGSILIPAMEEEGYHKEFAAAVTAASSIIGPIIPPSIIMILYGSIMGVSIAGMFAAGIIPGVLMGILLMIISYFISKKRDYPVQERDFSLPTLKKAFKDSIVAMIMPLIILGGILSGVFTPTEAASVAVFYAIVVGFLYFKTLKIKDLWEMLKKTSLLSGTILIIVASASILGWIITREQIPVQIANMILALTSNRIFILLIINVFLLIVGMFMDITAALIVLAPILAPLAINAGVNPLHFGIIMTINLNIGLMTPPLGACLYVACGIGDIKLEDISKEILPFIAVQFIFLMLITYIPDLVMLVPRLLGFA